MRPTSLLALAQGFESVPRRLLASYEAQLTEREEPLGAVKQHEADSVVRLAAALRRHGATRPLHYEGFVFSFGIPQISSEFDLLKLTETTVVNIELKSEDVGVRRTREQLERNRHYLAPLGLRVRTYSFVSGDGILYELDESDGFHRASIDGLVNVLGSSGAAYEGRVEDLFKVSNYLVSPLNDVQKFLDGRYFLTNHQSQIRAHFLGACATEEAPVYMVYGSAGTGKTLLLYDLARSLGSHKQACIVHCGLLSKSHEELNLRQDVFRIVSAKGLESASLETFGAILVDEAQRMWPSQLRHVVSVARGAGVPLYLSLDRRQVLSRREDAYDVEGTVRELCATVSVWELSRKIRTNREIVDFIRALFALRGKERFTRTSHVKVANASDAEGARELVAAFRDEGYQYISFAHASHDDPDLDELAIAGCPNPHGVIGQEFDRVVVAVGPHFSMDDFGHRQLLYQALTRARDSVAFVTYRNDVFLATLLGM